MWLSRLLDTMRATVRDGMSAAVAAYEDKPRDQWLFDHPAQVLPCSCPASSRVSGCAWECFCAGERKGEFCFLLAIS